MRGQAGDSMGQLVGKGKCDTLFLSVGLGMMCVMMMKG